jgi:hypothetical protein
MRYKMIWREFAGNLVFSLLFEWELASKQESKERNSLQNGNTPKTQIIKTHKQNP